MQRLFNLSNQFTSAEASKDQEPSKITYAGKNDSIGILSIFHESTYNALTPQMRNSLTKNLKALEVNPHVKVVCLRSLNPKVFCAGANIKEFENTESKDWIVYDRFKELELVLRNYNKPIIAAVNKLALGGGFELALHSDIILATEDTQFGLPEIKLGLFPGIGGTLISKSIGK